MADKVRATERRDIERATLDSVVAAIQESNQTIHVDPSYKAIDRDAAATIILTDAGTFMLTVRRIDHATIASTQ